MKRIILLAFTIICWLTTIGQQNDNNYYFYKGIKKYVTLDKSKIFIITKDNITKSSIIFSEFKEFELTSDISDEFPSKFGRIDFKQIPVDTIYSQRILSLKQDSNIISASPYFFVNDTLSIGTSHYFYVKLKDSNDYSVLQAYADTFNVNISAQLQFLPLWYRLAINKNTQGSSLEIANLFYETGLFQAVDYAFLLNVELSCTNDTNFSDLWGLNNVEKPEVDINICDAWQLFGADEGEGPGEGIKVTVFDESVDINHSDLSDNILNDMFHYIPVAKTNYLPEDPDAPPIIDDQSHGTHVSGIIAAIKNNNLNVVGVAPSSKLMRVNFFNISSTHPRVLELFAAGMWWAKENGSDIINNSWHIPLVGGMQITSALEDEISAALSEGRNGKGTVVVFAAGNGNPFISYPANTNPDIICVGSMNKYGEISSFSNMGEELDVVAPGEYILSTVRGNGVGYKQGTSMAAPYVSGIAALILSKNPELTQKQVATIIEQTAKKIGNYNYRIDPNRPNGTWCEEAGYGLVDAYAALQKVQCYQNIISFNGKITENTIWNVDMYIYGNIIIETGATLTITSTIFCDQNTNILVKPGAKLIIDGGKLTNDCDNKFWSGIHIEGDRNSPQTEQYQGVVEIKNGAIIENSRNAISTWFPNNWNTTGGIIKATNSTFKNNMRSIEFLSYHHNNISSFTECNFIWDNDMFDCDNESLSHVTMYDVEGVKFIKCNFTNENGGILTHGILSHNSGLKVQGKLIRPSTIETDITYEKGIFKKFTYAIRVQDENSKTVSIANTIFNSNACGIYTSIVNNLNVTNCDFNIDYNNSIYAFGTMKTPPLQYFGNSFGICLRESTGYKIENNIFTGNFADAEKDRTTIGIQIEHSGDSPNEIIYNNFNNLYLGSRARGLNGNTENITGLQYFCNTFAKCEYGIFIEEDLNRMIGGIVANQGNDNNPAKNIFINNTTDIYNSASCHHIYYYLGVGVPINSYPTISDNITISHSTTEDNGCNNIIHTYDKEALSLERERLENEYLLLIYNYNNLLDGGQKDILLDKLQDTWQGDVWDLRNEYLKISPYLSSQVLIELVRSEKLPLTVCTEILLYNPEATQKGEFRDFMYKKTHYLNSLSISLIEDSWNTKTFRASVESNISDKLKEMEIASREIINLILNDTTDTKIVEYRNILIGMRNVNSKFELIDSYINSKDYVAARNILFDLQTNKNYEEDVNDYLNYIDLLESSNSNISENIIMDFAMHNTRIGHKSKSYIYFNGIDMNYHPTPFGNNIEEKAIKVKANLSNLVGADIVILPNPAKDYITITYNLSPKKVYVLSIYDIKGIQVYELTLNGNKGMQTIDLSQFKAGTYFYSVTNNKNMIKSDKLIIIK